MIALDIIEIWQNQVEDYEGSQKLGLLNQVLFTQCNFKSIYTVKTEIVHTLEKNAQLASKLPKAANPGRN